MNNAEDFDELARRKLDARSFPFEEGHWHAMQRVLAEERRRKRRGLYLGLAAGLLLLIGGGIVYQGRTAPDQAAVAAQRPEAAQVNTAAPIPATTSNEEVHPAPQEVPSTSTSPNGRNGTVQGSTTASTTAASANTSTLSSSTANTPSASTTTNSSASEQPMVRRTRNTVAAKAPSKEPRASRSEPKANEQGTNGQGLQQGDGMMPGSLATTAPQEGSGEGTGTPGTTTPGGQAPGAESPGSPNAAAPPAATSTSVGNANTPAPPPTAPPAEPDPMRTAQKPEGGGDPPVAPPPAAPPVIPPASPWEITVWGGTQRTHTAYSGAAEPWAGTMGDANAPAFGGEVMHMGRNLGLGTGLHYVAYAEHYQQPALFTDITAIDPVYTLIQVDTSLMIVTGSYTQNGQVYYTTQLMDTFIYVLDVGADTTVTRITTQQQADQVNRTSYLELPLLVDGHVDTGHWRFGLRGGPTVGLLTGRRGSVPLTDPMGSIDLQDQPFRSYMFGWTLRAYVRYQAGERWWLGVEPMLRGQLMNAYSTGELDRRSSAVGLGLSVSYRLR